MGLGQFQPKPARPVKESFTRKDSSVMFSIRLEESLQRRLKAAAAIQGRTMTEIVEGLLIDYLDD